MSFNRNPGVLTRLATFWKGGPRIDSTHDLRSLVHPPRTPSHETNRAAADSAKPHDDLLAPPPAPMPPPTAPSFVWQDHPHADRDPAIDTYVAVLKSTHGRGA